MLQQRDTDGATAASNLNELFAANNCRVTEHLWNQLLQVTKYVLCCVVHNWHISNHAPFNLSVLKTKKRKENTWNGMAKNKQTKRNQKQTSVSGRGMNTGGASLTLILWKSHSPTMYWTGIRCKRCAVISAMWEITASGTSVSPGTPNNCTILKRLSTFLSTHVYIIYYRICSEY